MSNYYLCETCAVKHIGGEMQSFIPFFSCSAKPTSMAGMIPIADGEIPIEVCPYYKPKVMNDEAWNTRAEYHGFEQAAVDAWKRVKAYNERTCHNTDDEFPYFECSECGCNAVVDYGGSGSDLPNYCPNCGARVIA